MKKFFEWLMSHVFLFGVLMFTVEADFLTRAIGHFKEGSWVHGLMLVVLFVAVGYQWIFKWSRQIK